MLTSAGTTFSPSPVVRLAPYRSEAPDMGNGPGGRGVATRLRPEMVLMHEEGSSNIQRRSRYSVLDVGSDMFEAELDLSDLQARMHV